MEGELKAARAIQMGLLPQPTAGRVPDTRTLDVHQLLETARTVGGDLYDFVLLESSTDCSSRLPTFRARGFRCRALHGDDQR